ncbi:hypothetical protein JCM14713_29210 [Desulfomicrobium salsuginis]
MLRDLLCRMVQEKKYSLLVLQALYPNGYCEGNEFVTDNYRFLLDDYLCGIYIEKRMDEKIHPIDYGRIQRSYTNHIESHGVDCLGFPESVAFKEFARIARIKLSYDKRYMYPYKPGCSFERAFDDSLLKKCKYEPNMLYEYGFSLKSMYLYRNLDGSINFVVCDFQSTEGELVKLPLSLWKTPSGRKIFDWLHPAGSFPLYRWDLLYGDRRPVLICEDEEQVEYLREKHPWLLKHVCLTTWSGGKSASIDGTDLGALEDRRVGIIVNPTRDGYKIANKLYLAMKRLGVGPIGFLMPWARLQADHESPSALLSAFDKDVTESMAVKGEVADRTQFVEDARERFDLDFDPDYIATAISGKELLALPVSETEVVLGPMIMKGDKVLVYAHRGSGKTWLICFIAVACASGTSLLDGQLVAPRPLRVLVIDGEMKAHELQKRYAQIFKALGTPEHLQENLRIVAATIQKRDIRLETPEDREHYKEEIAWADVIIADSMFCLFPSAMGSQLEGARGFNDFMRANSLRGKTTIVVDHTGKNKRNSYGTIGKELGLELVLKVEKVKNLELFRLSVEKYRNLGSKDIQSIEYMLDVDEEAGVADLIPSFEEDDDADSEGGVMHCMTHKDMWVGAGCDNGQAPSAQDDDHDAPFSPDELDAKIIAALKEKPELSVRKLAAKVGTSKGTADNRRKKLEQAGLLRPKGFSVEQEDDFGVDRDEDAA